MKKFFVILLCVLLCLVVSCSTSKGKTESGVERETVGAIEVGSSAKVDSSTSGATSDADLGSISIDVATEEVAENAFSVEDTYDLSSSSSESSVETSEESSDTQGSVLSEEVESSLDTVIDNASETEALSDETSSESETESETVAETVSTEAQTTGDNVEDTTSVETIPAAGPVVGSSTGSTGPAGPGPQGSGSMAPSNGSDRPVSGSTALSGNDASRDFISSVKYYGGIVIEFVKKNILISLGFLSIAIGLIWLLVDLIKFIVKSAKSHNEEDEDEDDEDDEDLGNEVVDSDVADNGVVVSIDESSVSSQEPEVKDKEEVHEFQDEDEFLRSLLNADDEDF